MQNFRTIKGSSELNLEGVQIEAEYRDKSLHTITFTDANGKSIRIGERYSSLQALVPAEPEKKEVHVLTGTVPTLGTAIREEFDDSYAAHQRKRELESAGVIENAEIEPDEAEIPF